MKEIKTERVHPTKLDDQQYVTCWKVADAFLKTNGSIRNKQIRGIAGIGYDQAIGFFNRAVSEKRLVRCGKASGTHYVLEEKSRGQQ